MCTASLAIFCCTQAFNHTKQHKNTMHSRETVLTRRGLEFCQSTTNFRHNTFNPVRTRKQTAVLLRLYGTAFDQQMAAKPPSLNLALESCWSK